MEIDQAIKRLAFIKYLHTVGIEQVGKPEPFCWTSVLTFHDAVELFLELPMEYLNSGRRLRDIRFMQYWDELNPFINRILGKEVFDPHLNLRREPEYVAIMINDEISIQAIAEVDYTKSDLRNRKLWMKNAIRVMIPIRFGKAPKHKDTLQGIRYTSFRKLITHKTTRYL